MLVMFDTVSPAHDLVLPRRSRTARPDGGRWTFSHPVGPARAAGFAEADVILPNYQSTIACQKAL
jgi:hypothetical protein